MREYLTRVVYELLDEAMMVRHSPSNNMASSVLIFPSAVRGNTHFLCWCLDVERIELLCVHSFPHNSFFSMKARLCHYLHLCYGKR